MPDYKKKKHNRIFSAPKPRKRNVAKPVVDDDIKMSAQKRRDAVLKQSMKVVKGKKFEQKRRLKIFAATVAVILLVVGIFQLILPMGVYESVVHKISVLGAGSYPISLESTQTINTVNKGSYYYVLTNTFISAYNTSGKELFSYAHGFESPILKTSDTRAIVFEQNGTKAHIFTVKGLKSTVNTEKNIITANISDSGSYVIATYSDKYAAAVTVYNKRGKTLYEWFSAENVVNNVAISPNGKKIAVSSFLSSGGQYKSVLSVLNFKSATPEYTENVEGSLIFNLDNTHRSYFAVVSENSVRFIKWSSQKKKEYSSDYSISLFRAEKDGFVAVFNRKSDKTDNHIVVFSASGRVKQEVKYKGIISDINFAHGHIYCIGESELHLLSKEGEILRTASYGFGAVRITATATNTVAVITDNKIEKVKLEQE